MQKRVQAGADMQKLADLIDAIGIGMLTTEEGDGTLRSRPLATLEMDSDGKLWFFTAMSSGKVEEIDQHRKVCLSYADITQQQYVSVSGHARLFRDPQKMNQLWTPWIEPWFPGGVDDPDLALLEVTIDDAEYWSAPHNKVQRLLGLAKALSTGQTERLGEHVKVHPNQ
jgi:general stress protein 26